MSEWGKNSKRKAGAVAGGWDYQMSPAGESLGLVVKVGKEAAAGKMRWDRKFFEDSTGLLGDFTGFPSDQFAVTAEGIYNQGQPGDRRDAYGSGNR